MARVLLIYRVNKGINSNIGVVRKLIGQVNGLAQLGHDVDYVIHDDNHIYLNNNPIYNLKLRFLNRFHNQNHNTKLVIDMPTYPYQKEHGGVKGVSALMIDRLLRKRLKRSIDHILHSGQEKFIFDIPTIDFSNGIDCDMIKVRTPLQREDYRIIAVGKWQYWHGLDRILMGITKYKERLNKMVALDIVGDGPELQKLKNVVERHRIKNHVTFHGVCTGSKLDLLFDKADIGLGTLGLFRKNVKIDSSLKNREYIARGLPIILCSEDADIKVNENFVCKVEEDESIINMVQIERFLSNLNTKKTIEQTRAYAEHQLSWKSKMKELMKELNVVV